MISTRYRLITTTRRHHSSASHALFECGSFGPCRSPRRTPRTRRREDIGPAPHHHHRRGESEIPGKRRSSKGTPRCGSGKGVPPGKPRRLHGLTCPLALEAADRFAAGFAFGDAAGEVVAGAGVPAQPGQGDAVERGVGLAVATTVEPATAGSA